MPANLSASFLALPDAQTSVPGVQAPPSAIGLCLSGGGSRALTCALGQLRALDSLGLMDQIFAISSVSGGTWANSLYTYLPASISDADFLGEPVLDPSKLTVTGSLPHALDKLAPNNLGTVPLGLGVLNDMGELLKLKVEWGYPNSDLWQGLVGHGVLRPFGLWSPDPNQGYFDQHYVSWTQDYLNLPNGTLARNPALSNNDFYTVSRKRPFPVFNTALFTDDSASGDLVPFEANFMMGVRQSLPSTEPMIGGGLMDAMAMMGAYVRDLGDNEMMVAPGKRPCSLADIIGCSSAAFAQELEEQHPSLNGVVPRYGYFPIASRKTVAEKTFRFADGGSLENLGLNAMLARGVGRVLVGVNSEDALSTAGTDIIVSGNLPPLFGLQPYIKGKGYVSYSQDPGSGPARQFRHSQVFPTSSFAELQQALWAKRQAGVPIVVRQTLDVLPNDWFGVAGNTTVDILWMYNDFVPAFWDQLSWEVRGAIDVAGHMQFPLYNTITMLELDAIAVNALAHLWCWNLAADWRPASDQPSNKQLVLDMFT